MSAPDIDDSMAQSRTKLIAMRRTRDSLAAMDRERAQDAASTEKGFKSAASLFTPQDLAAMRPTFAPNESYATATSTQLVGYGAACIIRRRRCWWGGGGYDDNAGGPACGGGAGGQQQELQHGRPSVRRQAVGQLFDGRRRPRGACVAWVGVI